MSTSASIRTQVHQAIDDLSPEQLAQVWEYVQQLTEASVVPLYHVHEQAVATGMAHLAEYHGRYLYGQGEPDE